MAQSFLMLSTQVYLTVFFLSLFIVDFAGAVTGRALELSAGIVYTSFNYNEVVTAPAKSSETALFTSAIVDAKIFLGSLSFLEARYVSATDVNSSYNGASLSTGAPESASDTLSFTNYEADIDYAFSERFFVYIGFGAKVWNRYLAGGSGYSEIYSWNYLPIGVIIWISEGTRLAWGVDLSARPTSNGIIKVITSQTIQGGQDSQMNLGPTTGYRLVMPFRWSFGRVFLTLSPWVEHSEIGQSNIVANTTLAPTAGEGIMEPNSKTDQYGLESLLGIDF